MMNPIGSAGTVASLPNVVLGNSITSWASRLLIYFGMKEIIDALLEQPYVGESNLIDQMFKTSSVQERQPQHAKGFFFLLSNGYLKVRDPSDWANMLEMIESSGIMNISPNLLKPSNQTLASICEKLFHIIFNNAEWTLSCRESLRERTMTLLKWLFSTDQDPFTPCVSPAVLGRSTPLRIALASGEYGIAAMLQATGFKFPDQKNWFADGMGKIDTSGVPQVLEPATSLWFDDVREYDISYFTARKRPWKARLYEKDCMDKFKNIIKERVLYSVRFVRSISPIGLLCLEFQEDPTKALDTVQCLLDLQTLDSSSSDPAISLLLDDLRAACFSESEELFLLILSKFADVNPSLRRTPSPLHAAAFAGNLHFCELLLSKGALNAGSAAVESLPTPLHLAALRGHTDIVWSLHEHGASVHTEAHYGSPVFGFNHVDESRIWREAIRTPFGAAIFYDHEHQTWTGDHISAALACLGATVPPWVLHMGVACANVDMVLFALKHGVDVNHRHKGLLAWHHLLSSSFLESEFHHYPMKGPNLRTVDGIMHLAKLLIDAGIDMCDGMATMSAFLGSPDLTQHMLDLEIGGVPQENKVIEEDEDISLLEAAILSECADMIDWALERSASVYDPLALSSAVRLYCQRRLPESFGRQLILRILNGRDKSLGPNGFEGLAVSICIVYQRIELLNDLLATLPPSKLAFGPNRPYFCTQSHRLGRETDLGLTTGERSSQAWYHRVSPLMYAVYSDDLTNLLISQGYQADNCTMTAAVRRGKLIQIKALMACYAPPLIYNEIEQRRHFIYEAIQANRPDIVYVLWDLFRESGKLRKQYAPLHVAVLFGRVKMVKYLLSHGADVDEAVPAIPGQPFGSYTALQIAADLGYTTMVQVLLKYGADINKTDPGSDMSALEAAAETGRIDMLQLLLNEGAMTTDIHQRQYARAIFFAQTEGRMVAARILLGCRAWTEEDEVLQSELKKSYEGSGKSSRRRFVIW